MKIEFHGAGQEVGRSCIEINDEILLDAGIKVGEIVEYPDNIAREKDSFVDYPSKVDLPKIKAVFISHAHLDHSGALPLFDHFGLNCPIFCTLGTKETAYILLKDALKIAKFKEKNVAYSEYEIERVDMLMKNVKIHDEGTVDKYKYKFFDAGHIPGSSSILLEFDGKKLLYTGDINTTPTQLLTGAEEMPHADIMICESTYGDREHTPRVETENAFLDKVSDIIGRGGSAMIAVFAVGRAQEVIMLLNKRKFGVPIYLDGMSKRVTNTYLEATYTLRNHEMLLDAVRGVKFVEHDRRKVMKQQGIFVTTSGMVTGGPIIDYLNNLKDDPKNGLILTGYQAKDSQGRQVMETGKVTLEGKTSKVACSVDFFDFSAHAGRAQLVNLIKQVNPDILILNHGDAEAINSLASEFPDKKVFKPKTGDVIEI
ncbi:MBL fold metallo-hydrolase [Candidatus Woesearchaeota archaeon]|nr:MBL fold metallo-hydrolase [Candidatus Woesearchaeota archaeon]